MNRLQYAYVVEFLNNNLPGKEKCLMDIGCGTGTFIELANENGWNTHGIEFNKTMIRHITEKNISVSNEPITEAARRFKELNAVTAFYVLEHIKDMRSFISDISKVLAPEGILMISVPNIDALVHRLYMSESSTFAGYTHLNFFNIETLNNFICGNNYTLIGAETLITQLNNIKKYFSKFGLNENSGLKNLLDLLTSEFIHTNFLGSNLLAAYRKNG